jgi:hypothetical protein
MPNQIRPLARLFRGMAELIDQDHTSHTSHTRYEAIAKAARVAAASATAEGMVSGRLWEVDGADLLASAYAFHAGLTRQAATAAHIEAMQKTASTGARGQAPAGDPAPAGLRGMGDTNGGTAPVPPPSAGFPRVDPHRLPGPRLNDLDPADEAKLWGLLSDLRGGQVIPRSQLIRLTSWLPTGLAAQLLRLLDNEPALVSAQAAGIRDAIDLNDPSTPVMAVYHPGLAGSRRASPRRRQHSPRPAGSAKRRRPPRPAILAVTPNAS